MFKYTLDREPATESFTTVFLILVGAIMIWDICSKISQYFKGKDPIDKQYDDWIDYCSNWEMCDYTQRDREFPFKNKDYGYSDHGDDGTKSTHLITNRFVSTQTYIEFFKRLQRFVSGFASITSFSGCDSKIDKLFNSCFGKNEIEFGGDNVVINRINLKLSSPVTWPNSEWFDVDRAPDQRFNDEFNKFIGPMKRIRSMLLKVDHTEKSNKNTSVDENEATGQLNYVRTSKVILNILKWLEEDCDVCNLGRLCDGLWIYCGSMFPDEDEPRDRTLEESWDYRAPSKDHDPEHFIT